MTLIEAAARLGLAASTLRVQIRNGKLRSTKRGRDHWITESEVARYRREHQTASTDRDAFGRPVSGSDCVHPGFGLDGRCLYCGHAARSIDAKS